ncbi:hypothetical protein BLA29_014336, partial [Euroglyphus maynei]
MPVGNTSAEDLASSDEIKVFKFEGEDEKRASAADLIDLKSSLITESDQKKNPSKTTRCFDIETTLPNANNQNFLWMDKSYQSTHKYRSLFMLTI